MSPRSFHPSFFNAQNSSGTTLEFCCGEVPLHPGIPLLHLLRAGVLQRGSLRGKMLTSNLGRLCMSHPLARWPSRGLLHSTIQCSVSVLSERSSFSDTLGKSIAISTVFSIFQHSDSTKRVYLDTKTLSASWTLLDLQNQTSRYHPSRKI